MLAVVAPWRVTDRAGLSPRTPVGRTGGCLQLAPPRPLGWRARSWSWAEPTARAERPTDGSARNDKARVSPNAGRLEDWPVTEVPKGVTLPALRGTESLAQESQ
jgi:hypothetical protein